MLKKHRSAFAKFRCGMAPFVWKQEDIYGVNEEDQLCQLCDQLRRVTWLASQKSGSK